MSFLRRIFIQSLTAAAANTAIDGPNGSPDTTASTLGFNSEEARKLRAALAKIDTEQCVQEHIGGLCGLDDRYSLLEPRESGMGETGLRALERVRHFGRPDITKPQNMEALIKVIDESRKSEDLLYQEAIDLIEQLQKSGVKNLNSLSGFPMPDGNGIYRDMLQPESLWKDFQVLAKDPKEAAVRGFIKKHYRKSPERYEEMLHRVANKLNLKIDSSRNIEQKEIERIEEDMRRCIKEMVDVIDVQYVQGNSDGPIEGAIFIRSHKQNGSLVQLFDILQDHPQHKDDGEHWVTISKNMQEITIVNPHSRDVSLFSEIEKQTRGRRTHVEKLSNGSQEKGAGQIDL